MIDLRSDTATRPTDAMRDAIAHAAVGDEQKREDPTVNELERRGAAFFGQQEAVFLPTATMANQIAGSHELMAQARRGKHYFGGAMRQAGIVAAAALYALEHHVDRIADDHARARRLAEGLADAGVAVDLEQVETNFVQIDVGPDRAGAIERMKQNGVLVSTTVHPRIVRAVTHLDLDDDDIEAAVAAIPAALTRTAALRAR